MSQTTQSTRFLTLLALLLGAQASFALKSPPAPEIQLVGEGELFKKGCLKDEANPDGIFRRSSKWKINCPLSDFLAASRSTLEKNGTPSLRLLIARSLRNEVTRLRNEAQAKSSVEEKFSSSKWFSLQGIVQALKGEDGPTRAGQMSREGRILTETSNLVHEISEVLLPFRQKDLSEEAKLLKDEALLELFSVWGETLRFQSAYELLEGGDLSLKNSWIKERVLTMSMNWTSAEGGGPLREWLRQRLEDERPNTPTRSYHLQLWLTSMELGTAPAEGASARKQWLLSKLRDLWVLFPKAEDAQRIRESAERMGISRDFIAPTLRELSFDELMSRSHALVKALDGPGALKSLRRIQQFPRASLTKEQWWEALQLHVRILRILDQRVNIPEILKEYLDKSQMLVWEAGDERVANRSLEMAKLYWTYQDPAPAQKLLGELLERSGLSPSARATALYYQARILEQKMGVGQSTVDAGRIEEIRATLLAAFDRALESKRSLVPDLALDLTWRRTLLLFDLIHFKHKSLSADQTPAVPGQAKDIIESLQAIRKVASADAFEKNRAAYWLGRAYELDSKVKEAKAAYADAYKYDGLSYYGNLSALALRRLGEKVKAWDVDSPDSFEKPDVAGFLESRKLATSETYRNFAKVWLLAHLGDREALERSFPALGQSVSDDLMSSKVSKPEKRKLGRAVAWLRRAAGDAYGSLKTAEVSRSVFSDSLETEDYAFLYPLPYWDRIQAEAERSTVNPWIVASLIRQESAFNPLARSGANALGLMQMIPPTAKEEARKLAIDPFNPEDLYEPEVSLRLGTSHLADLIRSFEGSWICSIAAYNAGRPPVLKWLTYYPQVDPLAYIERISYQETRNYVRSILRNFMNYQRIYGEGDIELSSLIRMPSSTLITSNPTSQPSEVEIVR